MRSITHLAIQNYVYEDGDCVVRRGSKYGVHTIPYHSKEWYDDVSRLPLPTPEDIPLPIQTTGGFTSLCFGDRIRKSRTGVLLETSVNPFECIHPRCNPLTTISWPELNVGDTVLVTPKDGDWCLMNRQPTLVHTEGTSRLAQPSGSPGIHVGYEDTHRSQSEFWCNVRSH